eukprot:CAMPEP_0182445218 /NCGR_PEP_ID=MMETSP1172-20130603/3422_1 /TAXON_ID=708627 /ORGANISM="Timspurckia oligopyrenoides, Strain CCMP3278" /LENGTH=240 /DNA_ID=CAMNT_0024640949 /DNA_START=164 /DNA_END=886 /DNA_ORIENTATION=-
MNSTESDLWTGVDEEQKKLMNEEVILVDRNDQILGGLSKKESHLISNQLPLHRAFSVLLFNTKHQMLLQQRASTKITFPSYWTNTCCSHPLFSIDQETDGILGAKKAAIRKLHHELGIDVNCWSNSNENLNEFVFMNKVHYKAESDCGIWGEHEIDYVLICVKDVDLNVSKNEVDDVKYLNREELKELLEQDGNGIVKVTPWFKYIVNAFVFQWWDQLDSKEVLRDAVDTQHQIHRFGDV